MAMSQRLGSRVLSLIAPAMPLSLLALFAACGEGGGVTPPVVGTTVSRVVSATPALVMEYGSTASLAISALAADGTPVPSATLGVTSLTASTEPGAAGLTVTVRATALGLDTLTVTASAGSSRASVRVPVTVRPAPGTVIAVQGAAAIEVDSAETRSVVLSAIRDGVAIPITSAASAGFTLGDSTVATVRPSGTANTFSVTGLRVGRRTAVLRLAGDSLASLVLDVMPTFAWLRVAYWYKVTPEVTRVNTFLGIGAKDSLLYEGPANGSAPPVLVGGLPKFTALSSSSQTACALTTDGVAWCAGSNLLGAVGRAAAPVGSGAAPALPWAPVDGSQRFVGIAVGTVTVLARAADGRVFGWGATPSGLAGVTAAGCGDGRWGMCSPVPFAPTRRFDVLSGGYAVCARELTTGEWFCGGFQMRLAPATNMAQLGPVDSVIRVSLGRFGPVTYVGGGQNGWAAVTADGRALNWEPFLYNQTSGAPVTRDTLVIRPELRWLVAPIRGFGIRADGIPLGFRAGQQLAGVPVVLSTRRVEPVPEDGNAADVCVRFTVGHDAACVSSDPTAPQTVITPIPRPRRP